MTDPIEKLYDAFLPLPHVPLDAQTFVHLHSFDPFPSRLLGACTYADQAGAESLLNQLRRQYHSSKNEGGIITLGLRAPLSPFNTVAAADLVADHCIDAFLPFIPEDRALRRTDGKMIWREFLSEISSFQGEVQTHTILAAMNICAVTHSIEAYPKDKTFYYVTDPQNILVIDGMPFAEKEPLKDHASYPFAEGVLPASGSVIDGHIEILGTEVHPQGSHRQGSKCVYWCCDDKGNEFYLKKARTVFATLEEFLCFRLAGALGIAVPPTALVLWEGEPALLTGIVPGYKVPDYLSGNNAFDKFRVWEQIKRIKFAAKLLGHFETWEQNFITDGHGHVCLIDMGGALRCGPKGDKIPFALAHDNPAQEFRRVGGLLSLEEKIAWLTAIHQNKPKLRATVWQAAGEIASLGMAAPDHGFDVLMRELVAPIVRVAEMGMQVLRHDQALIEDLQDRFQHMERSNRGPVAKSKGRAPYFR